MDVEELLTELVAIPSVSGEEAELASFLADLLEGEGFDVERQRVEEGRSNIIATRGDPETVLTTHMDTVPGQPETGEDEDYIYGRGSCDAKGSMAAMITAAVETDVDDIALVFDVGEEEDFAGIERLMERDWSPSLAVVGEPTRMERVVGQKGLLTLELVAEGEPAHGSKPSEGVNAIERLIDAIDDLRALQVEDPFFGDTRFNLALIEGGEADNVVPPSAEATVQFRTVCENARILERAESLPVTVTVRHDFEPRRFADAEGAVFPGFTEAFYWAGVADNAVLQGPGRMEDAHTEDERVAKRQLKDAVAVYRQYLREGIVDE
ncbi:MAG: M20/M25/M40 family metallo-hydrolase [Candidatus Nanohaloarchaea archaeon]|nr:M20/M25/M40 family metallo-hydrolase [Candidatus Nanohaloarchaea archaeon]